MVVRTVPTTYVRDRLGTKISSAYTAGHLQRSTCGMRTWIACTRVPFRARREPRFRGCVCSSVQCSKCVVL